MKFLFLTPLFFNKPYFNSITPFKNPQPLFSCTESEETCFIDIVREYQHGRTFVDNDNVTWTFHERQMKYYDPEDKVWLSPIIKKKFKPGHLL
jgi:hypothetical protein